MGDWRDVTKVFPRHEDIIRGFHCPGTSAVAEDVQWLLGSVDPLEVEV